MLTRASACQVLSSFSDLGSPRRRTSLDIKAATRGLAKTKFRCNAVPQVTLKFQTAEGDLTVECDSGTILRDVMLEKKVDLYTTWGKVWQCGGSGQCGTCIVKVQFATDAAHTSAQSDAAPLPHYRL